MTKPLSEQVAELEAEVERLNKRVVWLDDQREYLAGRADGLEEQRDQLKAERDRLEADAISDSIKRNFLEAQVRNREAERDDLQRQVQEARDERDALRAGQGCWPKPPVPSPATYGPDVPKVEVRWSGDRDFPCCSSRSTGYADEDHQDAEVTDWHESEPETVAAEDGIKGIFTTLLKAKKTEDERAQKVWDAWRTAFAEVYLGQDDDVTHADTRLTVHDLEVAPVGSQLARGLHDVTKFQSGEWFDRHGYRYSSADMIASGWANATLTTPEAQ